MVKEFSKYDKSHMAILRDLYYAWYTPKDAVTELERLYGIKISAGLITRYFHNFKAADLPRHDRTEILAATKQYQQQ